MRSVVGLAFVLVLSLAACKQGVGDRCQVNSDCADGLTCVLPPNGSPQTGGICTAPGSVDASVDLLPTRDAATPADAGLDGGGTD